MSRVGKPSEDWKRGVFRNPPEQVWGRKYKKQKPKKNIIYKETRANLFRLYARVKRTWVLKLISRTI